LARKLNIAAIPKGPKQRLGLEHVMGVYTIWKFADNKALAKKFIRDQQLAYTGHFLNSKFYNFPGWPGAVKNIKHRLAQDPSGKYTILYTTSRTAPSTSGYPAF